MRRGFASNYRTAVIAAMIGLCFASIAVRLYYLHVLDRAQFLKMIEKARYAIDVENARRGDILDSRGNLLATSNSQVVLGVDPQAVQTEDEKKWPELSALIGVPLSDIQRIFLTKTRPPEIKSPAATAATAAAAATKPEAAADQKPVDVSVGPKFEFNLADDGSGKTTVPSEVLDDQLDENGQRPIRWAKLRDDLDESVYDQVMKLHIKGLYGNRVYRRAYPHNSLAAHVIGFVNHQNVPVMGIEKYANFYLAGHNGWVVTEVDGRRHELAQFRTREVDPVDGYNVVLSIDSVVQDIVEQELTYIGEHFKPLKATIIVMDARTGFILALGNYPTFNPNEYQKASIASLTDPAVSDVLEPGSTFKIVATSGALQEGLVNPETTFDCNDDTVVLDGKVRRLPRDDEHFDHRLTLREVLSHSSNRGAFRCAYLLGPQKFYDYAKKYGFGEYTHFALGPESRGVLIPPDKWDGLTFTRMPMGHSVSATPLQITYAMGVIASGGELLRPQVIQEIRDSHNEVVFRYGREVRRRVISRRTAETMAAMLNWVTVPGQGTAPAAAIPGFQVAGKTGTAEKIINGKYSRTKHVASFVGFFPASRPAIVMSVIVDQASANLPGGVAYGSIVSAPSFRHIGEKLIQYLNIKPVDETQRPPSLLALSSR